MIHPLLQKPKHLLTVGLLWSPLCVWVVFLHAQWFKLPWAQSAILVIPPMLPLLFISLSLWFICRSQTPGLATFLPLLFTHLIVMGIVIGIWLLSIYGYCRALAFFWQKIPWMNFYRQSIPFFLGIGTSVYFITVLVYFLVLANQKARRAEAEALRQSLLATQAELFALKANIHPHFLFNALNTLGPLITQAPQRARDLVNRFADFLRYSFRYGQKNLVNAADEITHVKNYLEIEKARLGDRLQVEWQTDPSQDPLPMPPFLLLPLVENAIKHGISQLLTGGKITIRFHRIAADAMEIKVTNPFESPVQRTHPGVGLDILRRRLAALYGARATLTIQAQDGLFSASLRLPLNSEVGHEE